jgi:Mg2+-importing ATPase
MYFIIYRLYAADPYYSSSENQHLLFIFLFQAGWFIESMWSQPLVIYILRTPKIPFFQSHASWQVTLLTFMGIAILTLIPFTTGQCYRISCAAVFLLYFAKYYYCRIYDSGYF